jgi:hypothetical protein
LLPLVITDNYFEGILEKLTEYLFNICS